MSRLINKTPLTFKRSSIGGVVNEETGEFEEGFEDTFIHTRGSLQPYRKGKTRLVLPDGILSKDAYIYFTQSELKSTDHIESSDGDKCTIKGSEYIVADLEDWSFHDDLRTCHYQYLLVRRDFDANGN